MRRALELNPNPAVTTARNEPLTTRPERFRLGRQSSSSNPNGSAHNLAATRETSARKCLRFPAVGFNSVPRSPHPPRWAPLHRDVPKHSPASALPLPGPQPLTWPAVVGCSDRPQRQVPGHLTSPDVCEAAAACNQWNGRSSAHPAKPVEDLHVFCSPLLPSFYPLLSVFFFPASHEIGRRSAIRWQQSPLIARGCAACLPLSAARSKLSTSPCVSHPPGAT